jgi:hypothetical protein
MTKTNAILIISPFSKSALSSSQMAATGMKGSSNNQYSQMNNFSQYQNCNTNQNPNQQQMMSNTRLLDEFLFTKNC